MDAENNVRLVEAECAEVASTNRLLVEENAAMQVAQKELTAQVSEPRHSASRLDPAAVLG